MNVIVPLSNLNYYKLELDNLDITSELIIETFKIIKQNKNTDKTINQIVKLIKKNNNIGVFDILINILPYCKWIEWFKESLILKYYWDDHLLKKIQDINKLNIYVNMLNNKIENAIQENLIQENLIQENTNNLNKINNNNNDNFISIFDSIDINYNYTFKILKKRIHKFNCILLEIFDNFQIENYFGCDNVIFIIGSNQINLTNNIDLTQYQTVLTLFPIKKIFYKLKNQLNIQMNKILYLLNIII